MPTFSLKDFQLGNPAEMTQGISRKILAFIATTIFHNKDGRKRRLLSYLGYLNNVIYAYACDRGVIKRISGARNEHRYHIDKDAVPSLLERGSVKVALSGTRDYLKEWWGNVSKSVDTIKEMRSRLTDIGIFTFEIPEFKIQKKGQPKANESSAYNDFDVVKALLIYEAIERLLVDEFGWDALPEHKGAMMKRLYDLVFKMGLGMRRSPDPDAGTGDEMTEDEAAIERDVMRANSKTRDRNEFIQLESTIYQYMKSGADHVLHVCHLQWKESCDRLAYLKSKLFSRHESVPMDADLPY